MEAVVSSAVGSTTATVVSILTTNIPTIMVVFAGLVGLGMAIRLVTRLIGRRGV